MSHASLNVRLPLPRAVAGGRLHRARRRAAARRRDRRQGARLVGARRTCATRCAPTCASADTRARRGQGAARAEQEQFADDAYPILTDGQLRGRAHRARRCSATTTARPTSSASALRADRRRRCRSSPSVRDERRPRGARRARARHALRERREPTRRCSTTSAAAPASRWCSAAGSSASCARALLQSLERRVRRARRRHRHAPVRAAEGQARPPSGSTTLQDGIARGLVADRREGRRRSSARAQRSVARSAGIATASCRPSTTSTRPAGRAALVFVLAGADGAFGRRDSAQDLLPPVVATSVRERAPRLRAARGRATVRSGRRSLGSLAVQALPFVFSLLVAVVLAPLVLAAGSPRPGMTRENYRGRRLPVPLGVAIVPAALIALIPVMLLARLTDARRLPRQPRASRSSFVPGRRAARASSTTCCRAPSRGWRGHAQGRARAAASRPALLKAAGTLGLALLVASSLPGSDAEFLLAAAVLVLATNAFNLLDLRPGRSVKAFVLLGDRPDDRHAEHRAARRRWASSSARCSSRASSTCARRRCSATPARTSIGALAGRLARAHARHRRAAHRARRARRSSTSSASFGQSRTVIEKVPGMRHLDSLGRPS